MSNVIQNPYKDDTQSRESHYQSHGSCQESGVTFKSRLSPFMDLNELIQVGMIGLIEAASHLIHGIEFEHFAHRRVRAR